MFSLKGPRYATHRRVLAEAGPSIERFFASGVLGLKSKLGPILWQLPPTKAFDPGDFAAFLVLLPKQLDGRAILHAVEVRHDSFLNAAFVALLRAHSVAAVLVDSGKHPLIADITADFVYARLQRTSEAAPTGYTPAALRTWADRARTWAEGRTADDLATIAGPAPEANARDVFIYMIAGAKVRAPAAAVALIERLK